ncbi:two component regulator [Nitzschia inconspicua]|uniref:Two component regulator n=1 Tax=Nitzschia inconspicua TaxID=303405 RepID=A0A9K3KPP3_9STRA|nr:two component regulator [Nitzschia inconspicua]
MSEKQRRPLRNNSENLPSNDYEKTGAVVPQEGNPTVTNVAVKPNTRQETNVTCRKPPLPSTPTLPLSPKARPTRASASRLALEDKDEHDLKPVQPPQRRDRNGSPTKAPEYRSVSRTLSSSDTSSRSVPMPPPLTYQLTDPISNKTRGARTNPLPPPPTETSPAHFQQFDSLSEDALSSRSNSIQSSCTDGTTNTLDLVLAKRYAAYYGGKPSEEQRASEQDNIKNAVKRPSSLTTDKRSSGNADRSNQIVLDEKRRKARGYISRDIEDYVASSHMGLADFEDEHDDESQDNSLSTTPDPPSLRLREHYLRPGAYRMRQGEEGRHVDNDSLASSSLRTLSTLRTNIGIGIIEASLVEDEGSPKRKGKRPYPSVPDGFNAQMSVSDSTPAIQNLILSDTGENNEFYIAVNNRSYDMNDDGDREMPSAPSLPTYAIGGGAVTVATTSSCDHVVEALPLDERHTIRAFFRRKKIRCMLCILGLVFGLLTVGTVYAVTGFVFMEGGNGATMSAAPSSSPTPEGDMQLKYFVQVAVHDYTREALKWNTSPQSKALQWLKNNTSLEAYPVSRRLQRFALATLYFSTGGERRWEEDGGWMSDEDECTWFSTEDEIPLCEDGNYKVISLRSNGLRGTIPPELSLLSLLKFLILEENVLTGFIPGTLGELTGLKEIRLFDNYLTGKIPSELSTLSNMEILDLEYNILAQILPPSLGQMTKLEQLLLDRNSFVGTIPYEFKTWENLKVLYLFKNELSGSIPSELGELSNLVDVEMDVNRLVGKIPPEIGQWRQLQHLNLGNNTLSGTVPSEIGLLTQLRSLDIFSNELVGTLSSHFGMMTMLQEIYLERNYLDGRLPLELGNLTRLKTLWLFSNGFVGVIPSQIGLLTQLEDLDVSHNEFGGLLPTELGFLSLIQNLNLSSNNFTGSIPSELGLLTALTSLSLHDNAFTGIIPTQVCNLVSSFALNLTVECSMVQCNCCRCSIL